MGYWEWYVQHHSLPTSYRYTRTRLLILIIHCGEKQRKEAKVDPRVFQDEKAQLLNTYIWLDYVSTAATLGKSSIA